MKLNGKYVILTGATGGIGRELAVQMAKKGAHLALVGRSFKSLQDLAEELRQYQTQVIFIVADLEHDHAHQGVVDAALQQFGKIDLLVNNAGIMDFVLFEQQIPERIEKIIRTNVIGPLKLTQAILPHMLKQKSGAIANIGSIFGSIGFPHYATYSASKFALRGFSQALRRELKDTPIRVTYIAPRAVDTNLNDSTTQRMLQAANITMDSPDEIARLIIHAIERGREEYYIGQPESFFAWLNGVFPRIINQGLKKQTRLARNFADRLNKLPENSL